MVVYTVGHSTRSLEEFVDLLRANRVMLVADVRTVPRSRRNPQFNRETLPDELRRAGIAYEHLSGLGGWRKPRRDSPNTAWELEAFRGYADYMLTPAFEEHLAALIALAESNTVAVMCAEAVHYRCHRRLISDALLVRGVEVLHILGRGPLQAHTLTPWARPDGTGLTYPATDPPGPML